MKVALQGLPEKEIPQPENVVSVRINPDNGLLARDNQRNAINEFFRETDVPEADESSPALVNNQQGATVDNTDNLF